MYWIFKTFKGRMLGIYCPLELFHSFWAYDNIEFIDVLSCVRIGQAIPAYDSKWQLALVLDYNMNTSFSRWGREVFWKVCLAMRGWLTIVRNFDLPNFYSVSLYNIFLGLPTLIAGISRFVVSIFRLGHILDWGDWLVLEAHELIFSVQLGERLGIDMGIARYCENSIGC